VGINTFLEDLPQGTVCFDQLFSGNHHLFATLVSSRIWRDPQLVGDAKPAELDHDVVRGTVRSIFRRALRGMQLHPVPTDPNKIIIVHRPTKRALTNVDALRDTMVRACFVLRRAQVYHVTL
jgi:hypothetical protein